jgi:hypothetical protein
MIDLRLVADLRDDNRGGNSKTALGLAGDIEAILASSSYVDDPIATHIRVDIPIFRSMCDVNDGDYYRYAGILRAIAKALNDQLARIPPSVTLPKLAPRERVIEL